MRSLLFALAIAVSSLSGTAALAQQMVSFPSSDGAGNAVELAAQLSLPKSPSAARSPAVVLLHSKGGWETPVTGQYASALSAAGYVVLEPRLFRNGSAAPPVLSTLPMAYDALRYLAGRDDVDARRIGVAGFSYGGTLALHAAAAWAQAAYAKTAGLRFAAHAPFYPVCWAFAATAAGKRKPPGLPDQAFAKWSGAPVHIFAGGRDDYDERDANACAGFVAQLPEAQRGAFAVTVYPEATHGWDQASAKFFEPIACKGRGCINTNEANADITRQGIADLTAFFGKTLGAPQ
jgi:dienelactone hydrolase